MGLEFRRGRDGAFLPNWYGRVEVDGKSKVVNLKVKVRGQRPPTLRQQGDALFEASREQAQDRFDEFQADARDKGSAAHLTKRLIQFKTGRKVEYVKLGDLAERWRLLGRENQPKSLGWLGATPSSGASPNPSPANTCTRSHHSTSTSTPRLCGGASLAAQHAAHCLFCGPPLPACSPSGPPTPSKAAYPARATRSKARLSIAGR